jgi:hypothetical protein
MAGTLNTTTTQTLAVTSSIQQQFGTQLTNSVSNQLLNLGNFVTNVSILPFIPSATIVFNARGMKPNTRLYAYFNNVPVSAWCAPISPDYDPTTLAGQQLCQPFGTPLYSDSSGNVSGIFRIPQNTFQSQQITFELNDISDLSQGADAITTQADGTYYGSTLSVANGSSLLNTRQTVLSSTQVSQQQTVQGLEVATAVTQQYISGSSSGGGGGDNCGCGSIICTKLYELGLLDEETYKADQEFGEYLRLHDPDTYWGYIKWASIVVDWMSGNTPDVMFWIKDLEKRRAKELELTLKITHRIATPWAQHMQFLMGKREKDNKVGKLIMNVGKPISKIIYKLPFFNSKSPSKGTKYFMLGLFFTLYSISKAFGDNFGFETNKYLKLKEV